MDVTRTAMALIVDRSGSMESIASDVKGSVKQFISDQKQKDGQANLTVAQFDDQFELVYDNADIRQVDEEKFVCEYKPRGMTALLDAIGRTVRILEQKIEAQPEAERPKRVVVALMTDGYENSSREFNLEQIKTMIKAKEAQGWDFMFLGATIDAIDVAQGMGFAGSKSAVFASSNFGSSMNTFNAQVMNARSGKEVNITSDQRESMLKA